MLLKGAQVDHFWPLRNRFLPFDRGNLENSESQRYMSIRARRDLSKNGVIVPPGRYPIRRFISSAVVVLLLENDTVTATAVMPRLPR